MRVADERDAEVGRVEAQLGGQPGEHVLPDRVARGGVEEPVAVALALRAAGRAGSRGSPGRSCRASTSRPARRRARSPRARGPRRPRGRGCRRARSSSARTASFDAGVGLGAVADEVAEAPDLLRPRGLGSGDHRLEGVAVAVDVGTDGDLHGVASIRCRDRLRLPTAVVAAIVVAEAAVLLLRPKERYPVVPTEPRAYFSAAELERAVDFRSGQLWLYGARTVSSWGSWSPPCGWLRGPAGGRS